MRMKMGSMNKREFSSSGEGHASVSSWHTAMKQTGKFYSVQFMAR